MKIILSQEAEPFNILPAAIAPYGRIILYPSSFSSIWA